MTDAVTGLTVSHCSCGWGSDPRKLPESSIEKAYLEVWRLEHGKDVVGA